MRKKSIIAGIALALVFVLAGCATLIPTQQEEALEFLKLDDSRPIVYNANYKGEFAATSYKTELGTTYRSKALTVPFINIDTEDAAAANAEMEEIYRQAVSIFNAGVENKISYVAQCDYESVIYGNVLSVHVTLAEGATGMPQPIHYAFNFDLETGDRLSYDALCERMEITAQDADASAVAGINKTLDELLGVLPETSVPNGTEGFYKDSLHQYSAMYSAGETIAYVTENGGMYIVTPLSVPFESGVLQSVIPIIEKA